MYYYSRKADRQASKMSDGCIKRGKGVIILSLLTLNAGAI
jgi:hypothetical protein